MGYAREIPSMNPHARVNTCVWELVVQSFSGDNPQMYTRQSSELLERGKHEKRKRGVRMELDTREKSFEDSSLLAVIREAKKFRDDFSHRRMGELRIH